MNLYNLEHEYQVQEKLEQDYAQYLSIANHIANEILPQLSVGQNSADHFYGYYGKGNYDDRLHDSNYYTDMQKWQRLDILHALTEANANDIKFFLPFLAQTIAFCLLKGRPVSLALTRENLNSRDQKIWSHAAWMVSPKSMQDRVEADRFK